MSTAVSEPQPCHQFWILDRIGIVVTSMLTSHMTEKTPPHRSDETLTPVPTKVNLSPRVSMDLSWLSEGRRWELLENYTRGLVDIGRKAQEMREKLLDMQRKNWCALGAVCFGIGLSLSTSSADENSHEVTAILSHSHEATAILSHYERSCTELAIEASGSRWANDIQYNNVKLQGGKNIEVIQIECFGHFGSGGYSSYIVFEENIYRIFGGFPDVFQLGEVPLIAWTTAGYMCERDWPKIDYCIRAMYWNPSSETMRYLGDKGDVEAIDIGKLSDGKLPESVQKYLERVRGN